MIILNVMYVQADRFTHGSEAANVYTEENKITNQKVTNYGT